MSFSGEVWSRIGFRSLTGLKKAQKWKSLEFDKTNAIEFVSFSRFRPYIYFLKRTLYARVIILWLFSQTDKKSIGPVKWWHQHDISSDDMAETSGDKWQSNRRWLVSDKDPTNNWQVAFVWQMVGCHVAPWYWLMVGGNFFMELMGFDPMTSWVSPRLSQTPLPMRPWWYL